MIDMIFIRKLALFVIYETKKENKQGKDHVIQAVENVEKKKINCKSLTNQIAIT